MSTLATDTLPSLHLSACVRDLMTALAQESRDGASGSGDGSIPSSRDGRRADDASGPCSRGCGAHL